MYVTQDAPRDWPRPVRSRATINASFITSLLTLLFLALAVNRVHDGDLGQAFAYLTSACYLAHFVAQFLTGMRQIRVSSDPPGRVSTTSVNRELPFFIRHACSSGFCRPLP
ncbi:hypothetical protein Kisp02_67130 [Kineosporia sp. NBRC 101731]|nr:hypothetical protein Kisp02_67130 [Kineosporia sp. NBRC 101731]